MKLASAALAAAAAPLVLALPTEICDHRVCPHAYTPARTDRSNRPSSIPRTPTLHYARRRLSRHVSVESRQLPFSPIPIHIVKTIANPLTDTQAAIFKDDSAKELIPLSPERLSSRTPSQTSPSPR
ncbi:hypothetical protein OPT61_g9438 [Boeremia exigua]|uniref:Uncharacterized protein n=1 Tax=Boeremia exigua TaxID=749465 RepID=A0ACC2HU19_9PLEO|nr:hypothetical protein OPT61_g9438 [Boeremia exigua]